jgi:hypothetical protein
MRDLWTEDGEAPQARVAETIDGDLGGLTAAITATEPAIEVGQTRGAAGRPRTGETGMVDATQLLDRLRSQLERGFFSVPRLCDELAVGRWYVMHMLTDLADRDAIERLTTSPYLRITSRGDRIRYRSSG